MEINLLRTEELRKQEKYIRFNNWVLSNGAKINDTDYPVCFGNGLIGIKAREVIPPNKVHPNTGLYCHTTMPHHI